VIELPSVRSWPHGRRPSAEASRRAKKTQRMQMYDTSLPISYRCSRAVGAVVLSVSVFLPVFAGLTVDSRSKSRERRGQALEAGMRYEMSAHFNANSCIVCKCGIVLYIAAQVVQIEDIALCNLTQQHKPQPQPQTPASDTVYHIPCIDFITLSPCGPAAIEPPCTMHRLSVISDLSPCIPQGWAPTASMLCTASQ
jgi:hypothetical protein